MERMLEGLGRSFLIAGLAPAVAFLVAQAFLIRGLVAEYQELGPVLQVVPLVGHELSTVDWATLAVVGGIVVGAILVGLNGPIIRLYEGVHLIQVLALHPLQRRNERRQGELYRDIVMIRKSVLALDRPDSRIPADDRRRRLVSAELELHRAHDRFELEYQIRPYPMLRPALPTRLGNAYAVLEEYPFERYGIDSMVFWSRLVAVMPRDYLQSIGDQKTICDLLLNLSLLTSAVGLESLGIALVGLSHGWTLWGAVVALVASLSVAYGLYRSAVSETVVLGKLIGGAFDLYRRDLLRQLGVKPPLSLREERERWQMLAAFIRRGEAFYYAPSGPGDGRVVDVAPGVEVAHAMHDASGAGPGDA